MLLQLKTMDSVVIEDLENVNPAMEKAVRRATPNAVETCEVVVGVFGFAALAWCALFLILRDTRRIAQAEREVRRSERNVQ